MRKIGDHAVVLGASIGGLLAARVLADAYQRVTIVDPTCCRRARQTGGGQPGNPLQHAQQPRRRYCSAWSVQPDTYHSTPRAITRHHRTEGLDTDRFLFVCRCQGSV